MDNILGTLALFMEQHQANQGRQGTTKALKTVVANIGRFDSKNISKFLRVYICEMEVYQVGEDHMFETFDMSVVLEIREWVQEIHERAESWTEFAELLRDEYFEEDSERMTKRSFLEWMKQRPGDNMGRNKLFKDFEKKYSQLPLAQRHLLETKKAELFCQAANEGLEDRLLILLGDRTTEGGFTNDWRVGEIVTFLAKQ